MGHAGQADERLELLGDELRPMVGDDARRGAGMQFTGALQDRLHVSFRHRSADVPMHDETTATVEHAAQEVEGAADIEVRDIDVPMLVRRHGLHEAVALARWDFTNARWPFSKNSFCHR